MLSTFIVVRLIYQSLVCDAHVQAISFDCPTRCRCNGTRIISCAIDTIMQYPDVGRTAHIEKLSVSSCQQSDFNSLSTDTMRLHQFSQMSCHILTLLDGNRYSNCVYRSTYIPTQNCVYICSKSNIALLNEKQRLRRPSRKCICYTCGGNVNSHRGVMRVRRSNEEVTTSTTAKPPYVPSKWNLHFILGIGGLSIIAFLINFILMVKLVCSPLTVIDMFGIALMIFNSILSIYGMSMAFYLFRPMTSNVRYCQFFVSIKFFSLGSALYTMTFMIFHRPIESSSEGPEREVEEGKKKLATKDAIFKGIVFLLEAVMLAGVLGVLSWIKTDDWQILCVVITPVDSVDGLLDGIEVWYFILCGSLISWYIGNYLYRKYKILMHFREKLIRIRKGEEDEGLLGNDIEQDPSDVVPYIVLDFPIFVMISLSFCIWVGGYNVTSPRYKLFDPDVSAVIRTCTLILPIIVQPIVYIIRDTCCFKCPCFVASSDACDAVEEIKLSKCPSDESSPSNNNLQIVTTKFENTTTAKLPIAKVELDLSRAPSEEDVGHNGGEAESLSKKNKKRTHTNEFEVPKVVCRSPIQSSERTRLLDDTDGKKPSTPTIIIEELDVPTEHGGLINGENDLDVNGRVSRGPTFYPIADKEVEARQKQVELKSYTPIKEKKAEEDDEEEAGRKKINNNRKEKRKDKKRPKKTNSGNSTASLDWDSYSCSDSSSSHESNAEEPLNDINSLTKGGTKPTEAETGTMEWDPNKFEGTTSPTELTKLKNKINKPHFNNNNCEELVSGEKDSLLKSSNNNSGPVSSAYKPNRDVFPKTQTRSSDAEAKKHPFGTGLQDVKAEANHTSKKLKKPPLTRDDSGSVER